MGHIRNQCLLVPPISLQGDLGQHLASFKLASSRTNRTDVMREDQNRSSIELEKLCINQCLSIVLRTFLMGFCSNYECTWDHHLSVWHEVFPTYWVKVEPGSEEPGPMIKFMDGTSLRIWINHNHTLFDSGPCRSRSRAH